MKQRIITAVIFGVILISLTIIGGLPFLLLTYLTATIALYELLKMRNFGNYFDGSSVDGSTTI
jgi:phosphatidate cytidylyltransferase